MKKRIIPSILLDSGTQVCISQKFKPWRTVGALVQNLRLHINRQADELLIINLTQSKLKTFYLSSRLLKLVRQEVDIPISYCGAINSANEAAECINAGFDKVYITTSFLENPDSLIHIAGLLGSQSVGVALPYKRNKNNIFVWNYHTDSQYDLTLSAAINTAIKKGAGELLLMDTEKDGSMKGLDLKIIELIKEIDPSVPILLSGGAGKPEHFAEILKESYLKGVVAGSIFSLSKETPATIRKHCEKEGIKMRRCFETI